MAKEEKIIIPGEYFLQQNVQPFVKFYDANYFPIQLFVTFLMKFGNVKWFIELTILKKVYEQKIMLIMISLPKRTFKNAFYF